MNPNPYTCGHMVVICIPWATLPLCYPDKTHCDWGLCQLMQCAWQYFMVIFHPSAHNWCPDSYTVASCVIEHDPGDPGDPGVYFRDNFTLEIQVLYQPQYIDGLVQERRNSSALAMELCLSCTNPSIWDYVHHTLSWCQLCCHWWYQSWQWRRSWHHNYTLSFSVSALIGMVTKLEINCKNGLPVSCGRLDVCRLN